MGYSPQREGLPMTDILKDNEFEPYGESTVDDRKRISLTKAIEVLRERFQEEPSKIYFSIYLNKAGQILLSPATTIPLDQVWLFRNPRALESIIVGMAQAQKGELHDLGSFAQHAEDEIE
jgi:hypothetical protein